MTLNSDGRIHNVEIERSSGSSAIDRSVLLAIHSLREKIRAPQEPLDFILDFNLF